MVKLVEEMLMNRCCDGHFCAMMLVVIIRCLMVDIEFLLSATG